MNPFDYTRTSTVDEALQEISGHPGAKFLGGGTNLVDLLKMGVETHGRLIDVSHLPESKIEALPGIGEAEVELVWDPPWNQAMISEAGKMQLGIM